MRAAELTYTTKLANSDTVLPRFTAVEIAQNSEGTVAKFPDAFAENRVRSLLHYCLALIEDPARRIEPFTEILAPGYALNFSSSRIADAAAFEKWFRGPASAIAAGTHDIQNFTTEAVSTTEFKMAADMDWEGIMPDRSVMTATTHHTWVIVDDPKERFARIKSVDVAVTRPLAPKP